MRADHNPIGLAKGILWEEAKGKLRALVACDGNRYGSETPPRFEVVSEAIEDFIKQFEDRGLHE